MPTSAISNIHGIEIVNVRDSEKNPKSIDLKMGQD